MGGARERLIGGSCMNNRENNINSRSTSTGNSNSNSIKQ